MTKSTSGTVRSTGRVDLTWPHEPRMSPGDITATLGDVEVAFNAWIAEARRRGCPDDAPVFIGPHDSTLPSFHPHLAVIWETDDDAPEPSQTGGL